MSEKGDKKYEKNAKRLIAATLASIMLITDCVPGFGAEAEQTVMPKEETSGSYGSSLYQYNRLKYRGYYYDADLGLYYLNSRFYDP